MFSNKLLPWLLALIPVAFLTWFLIDKKQDKPIRYLPYYGPKYVLTSADTNYHQVPVFRFVNQDNRNISDEDVRGKIYVSEFFFTTCRSICPVMNTNLASVSRELAGDENFLILSHTVDPETDSVPVLKSYADNRGVNTKNWHFLTGSKKELYDIARKGYLLDAAEGNGDEEDFIHTQNFALIDCDRHIRGYYDGTDSADVQRMLREIMMLKKEMKMHGKIH